MLKDIKNIMSLKRPNNFPSITDGVCLQNLSTGEIHFLEDEFIIGRALGCSLVIGDISISRQHCIIKKSCNHYTIKDNGTGNGTYVNYTKIPGEKKKTGTVVLNHGDIIALGADMGHYKHLFRFISQANADKKIKLDACVNKNKNTNNDNQLQCKVNEEYKKKLLNLHSDVETLKFQNIMLKHSVTQLNEFQDCIKKALDFTAKLRKKVQNQNLEIEELKKHNSNNNMIHEDGKLALQETVITKFKDQAYTILENDFQCPICNELMVKACTVNCSHSFCENCINTWLKKSKICPVCRTLVKTKTGCLTMDNFINNFCEFLGSTAKEQREKVQNERLAVMNSIRIVQVTHSGRGGGRGRGRGSRRGPQQMNHILQRFQDIQEIIPIDIDLSNYRTVGPPRQTNEPIEVVDLTHSMSR
ncbi:E3 ubiquitin-protein ligase CHFR-like [Adelges cooleyi]|uniref:E3 ubiquitin-protein ligase CHFR-like n=1 Tax=Adelges cooleyi TaxID=133065 RepID=UPI00217FC3E4|nr:E3 ubiquitin-protein ligase CHFR-like [Adelges cooleyi]